MHRLLPPDSFQPGDRVRTHTGYVGTVYAKAKRAAADIRTAAVEAERDLTPYTIALDRGGFSTYRGHELVVL